MLKKLIAFCLLLNLTFSPIHAFVILPEEFCVKQRWLSLTRTFDIATDEYSIGTVHRRVFSWTTTYDFYTLGDVLEATAKQRFFSLGAIFDVEDSEGNALGRVEEHLLSLYHTFDIFSPTNALLATAKLNFWKTKYTISDPVHQDHVIATLHRPFFRLRDTWKVQINDPSYFQKHNIDSSLFIVIMAFQTDLDHWKDVKVHSKSAVPSIPQKAASQEPSPLQVELEKYEGMEGNSEVIPTEEELLEVETLTESYVGQEAASVEHESVLLSLVPLLYSPALTPDQKNTLCFMLRAQID